MSGLLLCDGWKPVLPRGQHLLAILLCWVVLCCDLPDGQRCQYSVAKKIVFLTNLQPSHWACCQTMKASLNGILLTWCQYWMVLEKNCVPLCAAASNGDKRRSNFISFLPCLGGFFSFLHTGAFLHRLRTVLDWKQNINGIKCSSVNSAQGNFANTGERSCPVLVVRWSQVDKSENLSFGSDTWMNLAKWKRWYYNGEDE